MTDREVDPEFADFVRNFYDEHRCKWTQPAFDDLSLKKRFNLYFLADNFKSSLATLKAEGGERAD